MERRSTSTPICLTGALTVAAALAASCTSDDSANWSLDRIEVGDATVVEIGAPSLTVSVSPDGSTMIYITQDGVCVQSTDESDADCADSDRRFRFDPTTANWSEDGTRALASDDFFRALREPDVTQIDIETLELDVLTDDQNDDVLDEDGAVLDVSPFFGPDGDVYFFRSESVSRDFELDLVRLPGGGGVDDAEPVESLGLASGVTPTGSARPIGDERWVIGSINRTGDDPTRLLIEVIDLDEGEITETDTGLDGGSLVDATSSHALVNGVASVRGADERPWLLVDLEDGLLSEIDFGLDLAMNEQIAGAGFSPDGSSIVFLHSGVDGAGTAELLALPVEDGRADTNAVVTLADADDLADAVGDDTILVAGLGESREIVWSESGRLVLAAYPERVLTFETSTS